MEGEDFKIIQKGDRFSWIGLGQYEELAGDYAYPTESQAVDDAEDQIADLATTSPMTDIEFQIFTNPTLR